jgi:hypothetical protein
VQLFKDIRKSLISKIPKELMTFGKELALGRSHK